ncbi:MAG: sensor histidine kinase [Gammaproteobacteria bacterium]
MEPTIPPDSADDFFLPDFCAVRMVFAIVLIAELFAFILVLAPDARGDFWNALSLVSLFVQWTALASAAVLCLARPLLRRRSTVVAATGSYVLLLLVGATVSEAGYRLVHYTDFGAPDVGSHLGFLLHSLALCAIVSAVLLRYFYVQHQWQCNVQREAAARLQALQARIRPHFLFNSMNTIAALIRDKPELAEAAVEDLADLFRATLGDGQRLISLAQEIELVRRYLHIEQLRLDARLRVEWDIDDLPLQTQVPGLLLQPLVENAIYHGIEPAPQGGCIRIAGHREGALLSLSVSNPVSADATRRHNGNHMALDNIRQRLRYAYEGRASLTTTQDAGQYQVCLRFPVTEPVT